MWSALDRIVVAAIGLGGNIIFANLLSTTDFGLLAMVAIFSALAYNLSSCGLSDGLIRKENPTERDYSTVMVFNGAFGLFFCLLFVLLAHPLSKFFSQPALVNILTCIGVCFFFQTLTFVQEARLRKELKMKQLAIIHILSSSTALILGLYLALNGYGYWALVSTQVFLSFFIFFYTVLIVRWMPRVAFYKDSFNALFGYGFNLMLSYIPGLSGQECEQLRFRPCERQFSRSVLASAEDGRSTFHIYGIYFFQLFFPILSNEPDPEKKKDLCCSMISWMSLLNVGMALILILVAGPAFNVLFGHKWDASIPVFRILAIYGTMYSLKQFFQAILKAYGHARTIRNITILEVVLQLILLVVALPFGLIAVAWSQTAVILIIVPVHIAFYAKVSQQSSMHIIRLMMSPLLIPTVAFVLAWFGQSLLWNSLNPISAIIANTLIFVILCIAGWEVFPHSIYLKYRTLIISKLLR